MISYIETYYIETTNHSHSPQGQIRVPNLATPPPQMHGFGL